MCPITSVEQGGQGELPRWVGCELELPEVGGWDLRPLSLSLLYSQTFSVKTV
jgi:hypothetical protein